MIPCRSCGAANDAQTILCRQCGQPVGDQGSGSDITTRMLTPRPGSLRIPVDVFTCRSGALHRSLALTELFAFKNPLVIGRTPTCDICLPHPSVSRTHALLERIPEGLRVRDLGSINGIRVGGRRIGEPVLMRENERLGIGPYLFTLLDGVLHSLDSSQSLRLEARHLEKTVLLGKGKTRCLLADVSLAVEPGEFVCLLGPSGSGKSTLMDCLNGRRPATTGQVLANGEDFYLHFDTFRQSLGYVPQRDIVHAHLPVAKALYYTARLRLPPDTSASELESRLAEVIELMELGPHQDTLVGQLSGGQVKRVSLGAELLARPCLLFIDEATSGLDAGTEARMMQLFRRLAHEGKSILCITHNVDNVDLCDLVVVLAGGRQVFYGPPAEARAFFRADRLSGIYDRLGEKSPEEWEKEFAASSLCQEFVTKRLESAPSESTMMVAPARSPAAPSRPERRSPPVGYQLAILVRRYLELLWRDPRTLRLLLLQAPIVALIVLLGFSNKPFREEVLSARPLSPEEHALAADWMGRLRTAAPEESLDSALERLAKAPKEHLPFQQWLAKLPMRQAKVGDVLGPGEAILRANAPIVPDKMIVNPTYTYILLCVLVISVLWFGCNTAAREIVKEEAIYARERAVNLGILPYLSSKFLVLVGITTLQVFLMLAILYGGLALLHLSFGFETPAPLYYLAFLPQFGVLVLLAMAGVALGLFLSASVSSPDRASTLLPYVLIPQIILCGGLLPADSEPIRTLAQVASPAYWAFRGIRTGETELPSGFPWSVGYHDELWIVCLALVAQITVMLLATAWALGRKDVRQGA